MPALPLTVVASYLSRTAAGSDCYKVVGDKVLVDREAVPMKVWGAFSKAMNALDYDFRGAEDAKQLMSKWHTDADGLLVFKDEHARGFLAAVGKKDLYKPMDKRTVNAVMRRAVKQFGTTENHNVAGFMLPDGRMLNMGGGGQRIMDHREIGHVIPEHIVPADSSAFNYIKAFMNMGAVRMHAGVGELMLQFGSRPTRAQLERIEDIAYADPDTRIVVTSGNNEQAFDRDDRDDLIPYIRRVTSV